MSPFNVLFIGVGIFIIGLMMWGIRRNKEAKAAKAIKDPLGIE